ncbi:MAG: alpha-amylase [Spirochaetaceae bacterium]|nr:alpha-amylase [Spirochaetaceae bacterium]
MNNVQFTHKIILNSNEINDTQAPLYEFHVSRKIRDLCKFSDGLFATSGNVILANVKKVREFTKKINESVTFDKPEKMLRAGQVNAMGLIDEIFHYVCYLYRQQKDRKAFEKVLSALDSEYGKKAVDELFTAFAEEFPPLAVYLNTCSISEYLSQNDAESGVSNRLIILEELLMLHLANENPAFAQFEILFGDKELKKNPLYNKTWKTIKQVFAGLPPFGPKNNDLITMLKEPVLFSPNSLKGQLDYIRLYWADLLGDWLKRLLFGIDMISEEDKPGWNGGMTNLPPMEAYNYDYLSQEYERYSPDREWMPRVVLLAKTVLVWLNQLSDKYQRDISRLDQIPDEELDIIASRGFTGLWLIGLWERSHASQRIKQINGNPEAAASAYSLYDYDIAQNLGGWDALSNLRLRCWQRGIRLASDMVPNHTGMDAKWVVEKPDLFIQRRDCPFPQYSFTGENLSQDGRVGIYLEDHYYQKSDCAVVFKRVDNYTGDTRYIYHGNDGTGMPWNDTAQIDFLNPIAREEVIQKILHVARNFPIIRFDAAMVLAKKHIKRLWYPEPGVGGDIATRSESALSRDEFENRIPNEFWREVVDRCAKEIPDTLLLAEAFWMMEGYFVRTLGMHRVYNSAFMNMLKKEENYKYRQTVKNTLEFDPQVLRRFVNFMNNPDEETAVAQFGKGDKYFGVCTLMVTMPGLPMFGHGQIEGFTEKYGMEYQKAYWKETPDQDLIERHNREIFPLMKKRYLFAEVNNFYFYDVWNNGSVNENVFAYSNSFGNEKVIVFYNNVYQQACGWIKESCRYAVKTGEDSVQLETVQLGNALGLSHKQNAYCIFHEQRSGLWFIRRSTEILDNGLFLSLQGFESQVLMNFSEVFDDETGKYRILYETLGGKGVEDIEIALQEIFLKDLYKAFNDFVGKDFITNAALVYLPENIRKRRKIVVPSLAKITASVEEKGLAYINTLRSFIEGNYGASHVIDKKKVGKPVPAEKIWKEFCDDLKHILAVKKTAEKPSAKDSKETVAFCKKLYEGLLSKPNMAEHAVLFCVLKMTGKVVGSKSVEKNGHAVNKLFGLDRKCVDALRNFGLKTNDTYCTMQTFCEVLPAAGFIAKDKKDKAAYFEVLKTVFYSPKAFIISGLNEYDGVRWFNSEKMTDVLWTVAFEQMLFAPSSAKTALVADMFSQFTKAQKASKYKADELMKVFAPSVKKNAAKKKTSGTAKTAKASSSSKTRKTGTRAKKR